MPRQPLPRTNPAVTASNRAFTLIELLTVIAIIGILAAIIIPVVGRARNSANDAQCRSSLRQWGVAIQLYVNDHKGMLPGPSGGDIYMRNGHLKEGSESLFAFLAPYVSVANSATGRLPDEMVCKNNRRMAVDALKSPVYHAHTAVLDLKGNYTLTPLGKAGKKGQAAVSPMNYNHAVNQMNPTLAKALEDVDTSLSYVGDQASLPQEIVHGSRHNVLYYDWHVGSINITKP